MALSLWCLIVAIWGATHLTIPDLQQAMQTALVFQQLPLGRVQKPIGRSQRQQLIRRMQRRNLPSGMGHPTNHQMNRTAGALHLQIPASCLDHHPDSDNNNMVSF